MSEYVFGKGSITLYNSLPEKTQKEVSFAETVLKKKRSTNGEIILTLFESCNLTCKFCNQDHDSLFGYDDIEGKFDTVINAITLLKKMRKETFTVNIMGGEIFQDIFEDDIMDRYLTLTRRIYHWAIENNETVKFGFISNLVHEKTDRIIKFMNDLKLEGIQATIGTSYDPHSRFNKSTLEVFRRNLEIYKDYIGTVNIILTKPNIEKFLNGDVPHFDYIYENFDVFFDYYTPEKNFELNAPKDHQLKDMFVYLINNYPNVSPVREWKNNHYNAMSCQSTYTIMPDSSAGRCTILLNTNHQKEAPETAGEIESKFVTKMDCPNCKYFDRCGLGCFLQQHFNGPSRTMNDCWMKPVHAEIDIVNARL